MEWKLLTQDEYLTTLWSGGTTTQLAIAPEGAVYADRDFLWRLSSAKVEDEHSDFTPLPDYKRLISILHGELELKIDNGARFPLAPLTVCSFDGGVPVESWGKCTDFNLMLRKDRCQGSAQSLVLSAGASCDWTAAVPAPQSFEHCTLALYCVKGDVTVAGQTAKTDEMLLCRQADCSAIHLETKNGAAIMAAVIHY